MKGTTNTNITPHSDRRLLAKHSHELPPIPEGYITLEEFMMNLLKEVRSRYEKKDSNFVYIKKILHAGTIIG